MEGSACFGLPYVKKYGSKCFLALKRYHLIHNRKLKHLHHKQNIIDQLLKVSQAPEDVHDLVKRLVPSKDAPVDSFQRCINQRPHQHVLLHDDYFQYPNGNNGITIVHLVIHNFFDS